MTAHSARYRRQKGHTFERDCADDFRQLGFDCITTRAGRGGNWDKSDDGVDLVGTDPYRVQCKRFADYAPIRAIEEVVLEHDGQIPLLLTKADRGETMAVLPWRQLQKLLRASNSVDISGKSDENPGTIKWHPTLPQNFKVEILPAPELNPDDY